ncbi:PREDICTED: spindle and kinetochore-associated protein 3 [Chrysochloris asiatica]|uniref:Spindle and kinetochore-associated protein 3 n=1 Tax=Chrysochloris asiatica TaxID=185453 RepID=A0A9B0WFC1_CHRAS|nr:PREDICTED: spindle and kinetochore-associated protein 3 [Chrysochloris asiatica]
MDPIRSFYGKLRSLAVTLDSETARLQRALNGEESDLEDYAMKTLCDLQSEVRTLKDDVNILLHKASLQSQESTDFLKATKVLMKRNSVDIIKIREFFQKYGYSPRAEENSVPEHEIIKPKLATCEMQAPDGKCDVSENPVVSSSVSEVPPRSPQLSDFGLERYMIAQVVPNPREINNRKEEPVILTPPTKPSPTKTLKTPKCALKMDDFECMTPKLEHFGISEYTYLNEDYTMGLKGSKSGEAVESEPTASDGFFASPGLMTQQLGKNDAACTNSPLAPTFCTPGLKIPSTIDSTALIPTYHPLLQTKSSTNDLDRKDCPSVALSSQECFENLVDPSSPKISSYENLLRTPTPPEVTTIPEDVLQILSKYNSNLATPVAIKAVPTRKVCVTKHEGQNTQDVCNKENGGRYNMFDPCISDSQFISSMTF